MASAADTLPGTFPHAMRIPYAFAQAQGVLPGADEGVAVIVYTRPNASADGLSEVRRILARPIRAEPVGAERFAMLLARAYNQAPAADGPAIAARVATDLAREADLGALLQALPKSEDLLAGDESASAAPVVRTINALILEALREHASDIHFEAFEGRSLVRFRIDGMLREIVEPPRALHAALVSRLKIMANLDIAERRLPQDGRIALKLGDKTVDVRVSTVPTAQNERVVLRLLDQDSAHLDLGTLGMARDTLDAVDALVHRPHGIVLVTGPTGSGKTTTLYAALSRLDRNRNNIMTVEDPIEYALDGVGQIQVNPKIDLTFALALRSILRQDPDVIMIGEIRDAETAQIAVQASLTGHLVLATLHTNDAASAVTILAVMGVDHYLLASSLLGVLAQRLVRTLCPECRVAHAPSAGEAKINASLGLPPTQPVWTAPGCEACNNTGHRGRTGVYELLPVDESLRRNINDGTDELALREAATRGGMRSLPADGARWLAEGSVSLAELLLVTRHA